MCTSKFTCVIACHWYSIYCIHIQIHKFFSMPLCSRRFGRKTGTPNRDSSANYNYSPPTDLGEVIMSDWWSILIRIRLLPGFKSAWKHGDPVKLWSRGIYSCVSNYMKMIIVPGPVLFWNNLSNFILRSFLIVLKRSWSVIFWLRFVTLMIKYSIKEYLLIVFSFNL